MFADLDESIRQLLVQRGNLDTGEVDIAFDMPTREWASGLSRPTVNLYLFDIRENTELRNPSAWMVRNGPNNSAIKTHPEVRIDLTYNITAFANAIEDEHHLLSRVLLTLLQNPTLPPELLQGEVAGQEVPTVTAVPRGIIQSPADYWGGLDNDIRPSIDYLVTLRLDLGHEITTGLALGSTFRLFNRSNGTQSATDLHRIGGRVHRREDPDSGLAGMSVTLLEMGKDATTDSEGYYSFAGVVPGEYTLIISGLDETEQRTQIQVPSSNYDCSI